MESINNSTFWILIGIAIALAGLLFTIGKWVKNRQTSEEKWNDLYLDMSPEELIKEYHAAQGHSPITLELIKSEIWRREADAINRRINQLTKVITILTFINTLFVGYSIFK